MAISRRQFLKRTASAATLAAFGPRLRWLPGTGVSYASGPGNAMVGSSNPLSQIENRRAGWNSAPGGVGGGTRWGDAGLSVWQLDNQSGECGSLGIGESADVVSWGHF